MNIILLFKHELPTSINDAEKAAIEVCLSDRRATHIINVIKPSMGDTLKIGIEAGKLGTACVANINAESNSVTLSVNLVQLNQPPPAASPIKLIVALPRPKAARRIIRLASECGIKEIHFIHSYRVEKSYWQSPLLKSESIQQQLTLGLEQSVDTQYANVFLHNRFKPFVEDKLPNLIKDSSACVLHPYSSEHFNTLKFAQAEQSVYLVIGPEGGFIPYEIDKLIAAGCRAVTLGDRILRTETIIPLVIGSLNHMLSAP